MSYKNSKFTVAEYFAGIGLVRLGLESAGWEVIFANDFAEEKYDMYASYFPDAKEHYDKGNVFDLEPDKIPTTLLATSSFPCIDLSLAGNQNGIHGKHSSAFWGFIKALKGQGERRPHIVMVENVPGWLTSNGGNDFRVTLEALNELGYACDVYALDAIHFTPQSRLRIFVIGVHTSQPNSDIDKLLKRSTLLAPDVLKKAVRINKDIQWNILPVPNPPKDKVMELDKIIEEIPDDDSRWWKETEVKRHLEMMAPSHLLRVEELKKHKEITYRTFYRRKRQAIQRAEVRMDNTAGCLRTARGGSSRQMVIKVGNGIIKMRHMTPKEYARLQGVPDDYPIPHNEIQALTGFGDAVCVPVITWIGMNVLNPLMGAGPEKKQEQQLLLF